MTVSPNFGQPMAWHSCNEMRTNPKAWYWAEFPGSWVWYCPEKHMTRCIDHGDTLWHEPQSKRYYGPWLQTVPTGKQPSQEAPERIFAINPIHAVAIKSFDDGDAWSIVPGTTGSSLETAISTAVQLSLAGDEETQYTAIEIKADGVYPVGDMQWGVHEI
ncbi:TPA: hypothetical protein MXR76_002064 [Pseudomonas aeruginosa]|uniref:hypothetical protein n=1 Tax=Pseudomonas aeruginosa TaxID=287 RepID=UPI0011611B35|nr:hypothetical protein [Pseudomonas aeruginosa]EKF7417515.1 hypothetical protein [Pseudomonas aeruginosa]HBO1619774.1 hypothetical protein [Pseudomonas aeruginosa]HCA5864587.1 hypothetical protein [Pseudomonas aeruginosa]HCA7380106.1 hypothetical protein [Pseudomonas aeruginosa]HCA7773075.1 hypothetical protein [Pseudomonas aeruginosa]